MLIDPALDAEMRYRHERIREDFSSPTLYERLSAKAHAAMQRFRATGREKDHGALFGALAELEQFEERQKKAPDQGQLVEGSGGPAAHHAR